MSRSGNKGFTLLEIMAAMAIIAIVLTALFRLHLQTLSMGADTRFYTLAPLLAQQKIAQIEAEGVEQGRSETGDFGEEFPRYRWEAEVAETDSVEFEKAMERIRRIEVRVFDETGGSSYSLRAYRYIQ